MKTGRFIVLRNDSKNKEFKDYAEIEIVSVTNKFIQLRFISTKYERWLTFDDFKYEFTIEEELDDYSLIGKLEKEFNIDNIKHKDNKEYLLNESINTLKNNEK